MHRPIRHATRASDSRGFTLIELLITVMVLAVVTIALIGIMFSAQRGKTASVNAVESTQSARAAMELMARDLRSAGYGADLDWVAAPQPPIAYVDSLQILINANLQPWPDAAVGHAWPLAYDPTGAPRPYPLEGTAWQPPKKYETGAEVIRYTFDVDDDGDVDDDDHSNPVSSDVMRTRNPDDWVLVRQVYGDSTANVAGNNGGSAERIALLSRPADGGVPPMFRVYMRGSATAWNWSNGPVPANQLRNIDRVEIAVTATSPKPDWRGRYAQTTLRTTVNSMRNTPDFGATLYAVDGFVRNDLDEDGNPEVGEPGLPGVLVRLGNSYTAWTSSTGYYSFQVPAGTYTLRHTPPAGFGVSTAPDSFVVTVPGPQTRSFADTARAGGSVTTLVYEDVNTNGIKDLGEPLKPYVKVQVDPGANIGYTDAMGSVALFAPVGAYTVTVTAPDSFAVFGPTAQSGIMLDGGTGLHVFGIVRAQTGKVAGKVYRDNDRDGVLDGGESGIAGVWVNVVDATLTNVLGSAQTDANGDYQITVPINDPPRTSAYRVFCIAPAGYFPTSATSIGSVWVQNGVTTSGKNFGMAAFQKILLAASRVLSLGSGDLIEKDWSGGDNQWDSKGRQDADIVLGADAGGTDNISVWFNKYDSTPLFDSYPTYTRNAPQSVLALALEQLDTNVPKPRLDLVTGTKNNTAGNFFVWLNQNSSSNLGYYPTTFSPAMNYRTADAGDVQAVLTYDCAGGAEADIIVGTKSPTAGYGTFEVWASNDAATPVFTRDETYPNAGNIPGSRMGEVNVMQLADFDTDGILDLVAGTKTGAVSGEIDFYKMVTKGNGNRFIHQRRLSIDGPVTALAVTDVDADGYPDIVCGVETSAGGGKLQYWHNEGAFGFGLKREVAAPGLVMNLRAVDLGGDSRQDVVMGWRLNASSYVGGVQIYFMDLGTLPASGVDPSSGSVVNMVPAVTSANFNYGVQPTTPAGPYLPDIAVGLKDSPTTGAVVVFIR